MNGREIKIEKKGNTVPICITVLDVNVVCLVEIVSAYMYPFITQITTNDFVFRGNCFLTYPTGKLNHFQSYESNNHS